MIVMIDSLMIRALLAALFRLCFTDFGPNPLFVVARLVVLLRGPCRLLALLCALLLVTAEVLFSFDRSLDFALWSTAATVCGLGCCGRFVSSLEHSVRFSTLFESSVFEFSDLVYTDFLCCF